MDHHLVNYNWLHRACYHIQLHHDKAYHDQKGVGFEDCGPIVVVPEVKEWDQSEHAEMYYAKGMIEYMISDYLICVYGEASGRTAVLGCVETLILLKAQKPEWPGSELHCETWYRFPPVSVDKELVHIVNTNAMNIVKFAIHAVQETKRD